MTLLMRHFDGVVVLIVSQLLDLKKNLFLFLVRAWVWHEDFVFQEINIVHMNAVTNQPTAARVLSIELIQLGFGYEYIFISNESSK